MKKREILAIVAVGCSRRTAAGYVGCSPSTITNEIQRDKLFAAEIERRERSAEIGYARNIQDAAKDARNWRAAAWFLERRYPDDFGSRTHGAVTAAQLNGLMAGFAQIISEEVPIAVFRKRIMKRMQRTGGKFFRELILNKKSDVEERAIRNATRKDANADDSVNKTSGGNSDEAYDGDKSK